METEGRLRLPRVFVSITDPRLPGKVDATLLHAVSVLALEVCIVAIHAMGAQANIAQAIRDRGADQVLAVKENQAILADSIPGFFAWFEAAPDKTPHTLVEVVEMDHGGLETRRQLGDLSGSTPLFGTSFMRLPDWARRGVRDWCREKR